MGAFSKSLARDLLRYSLPMIPNALAWWFVNLSGRYIVMFSQGADVAGLYTAASKLPAVMNMVVTIFQQSWRFSQHVNTMQVILGVLSEQFLRSLLHSFCVLVIGYCADCSTFAHYA